MLLPGSKESVERYCVASVVGEAGVCGGAATGARAADSCKGRTPDAAGAAGSGTSCATGADADAVDVTGSSIVGATGTEEGCAAATGAATSVAGDETPLTGGQTAAVDGSALVAAKFDEEPMIEFTTRDPDCESENRHDCKSDR